MTNLSPAQVLSHRDRCRLRWFRWILSRCAGVLAERYGVARAEKIAAHACDAYRALLPTLPPISLARDPMAPLTWAATWILALYQGSLEEGGTAEDVGWVLVICLERAYGVIPRWVRRLAAAAFMSAPSRGTIAALGRRSQRRRLPCTFVWRVTDRDEGDANLGIDYLQCPINMLLRDQGAGALVPYVCNTDYATFGALGLGFCRTKTLAWACSHCDFRIWRSGDTAPAWPPRFVERHCGREMPALAQDARPITPKARS